MTKIRQRFVLRRWLKQEPSKNQFQLPFALTSSYVLMLTQTKKKAGNKDNIPGCLWVHPQLTCKCLFWLEASSAAFWDLVFVLRGLLLLVTVAPPGGCSMVTCGRTLEEKNIQLGSSASSLVLRFCCSSICIHTNTLRWKSGHEHKLLFCIVTYATHS